MKVTSNPCSLPAGEVTVDFRLTLLVRLVVLVERLLGRAFESDLGLWSCSVESACRELNRWRGGVDIG